jgi:hypothetical protein
MVKGGRFGARVIVAATVVENIEVVAQVTAVVPHVVSSELHIPRAGLDHKSKAKSAKAEKDFASERKRSAALMNRIKKLETEAILSNQQIVEVEELLHVSHESTYRRMGHLKRAATSARTSAARKAA